MKSDDQSPNDDRNLHAKFMRVLQEEFRGLADDMNALYHQVVTNTNWSRKAGIASKEAYWSFIDDFKNGKIDEDYKEISIIFCDVCDFKQLNDSMGHANGDVAIRSIGKTLRLCTDSRGIGRCFHISGDEFIIVVPEKNYGECKKQLMKAFKDRKLEVAFSLDRDGRPRSSRRKVRLAFGSARVEGAQKFEEAADRADAACQFQKFEEQSLSSSFILRREECEREADTKSVRLRCKKCFTQFACTMLVSKYNEALVRKGVGCPTCGDRISMTEDPENPGNSEDPEDAEDAEDAEDLEAPRT